MTPAPNAASYSPARLGIQLVLLAFASAGAMYARTALSPLQETMRAALMLSDNQMALLQGPALALPMLLAAAPIGLAVDRHSRNRLLLIFASVGLLGSVLTAMASNITMLAIARALAGLAAPATAITASSLIGDLFAPAQRGRANMVIAVGQVGGMSAAFALGGAILVLFGSDPEGWRWTMSWLAVPSLLVVLLITALREPPRSGVKVSEPSMKRAAVELWRYRAMIAPLLLGVVVVGIADGASLIWAAPSFARNFGLAPDRVGAIMSMALLVSGIAGPVVGGMLTDFCQRRGGPRLTVSVLSGLALISAPAGLFAIAPSPLSASIPFAVFMMVGVAVSVAVTTLCTIVIPNELRGLCMSIMYAASLLFGMALAPLTVSLLSTALGGPATIGKALACVCALMSLLGAAGFAFGRRYFPRMAPA